MMSVAFRSDRKRIVSTSGDYTVRVWDITTGKELVSPINPDAGKDWLVVTLESHYNASPNGDHLIRWRLGASFSAPLGGLVS